MGHYLSETPDTGICMCGDCIRGRAKKIEQATITIEVDGQLTEEAILVHREITTTGVKVTIAGPLAAALEAWKRKR